jgi:hypothetical protein
VNSSTIPFVELWQSFSFGDLIWYVLPGVMIGVVVGFIVASMLQARGLLKRDNRWHHLLLKCHFLLLPLCGGGLGLQAAVIYGSQQQLNAQVDSLKPQVEAVSAMLLNDFEEFLTALDVAALPPHEQSVDGLLRVAVNHYLQTHTLFTQQEVESMSFTEKLGVKMLERFRTELLARKLTDVLSQKISVMLSEKAAGYTGLDKDVVALALRTPLRELIKTDSLLGLAKKQVASIAQGFYITVAIQLLLLIGIIWGEIALSRYLYGRRAQPVN